MADTTGNPNPLDDKNGLVCKWGDPEIGRTSVAVYVNSVDDVSATVAGHRDHVSEYALRGEDSYNPATSREEASDRQDEYVFLFAYVGRVTVIVGLCEVSISSIAADIDISDLVAPALQIGRTVGCSPYENDYVPPEIPEKWRGRTWVAPPFPPFRPQDYEE